MNIGFDLDGIFINTPPFIPKTLIDRLYRKKSKQLAYRMPQKLEQKLRRLSHTWFLRPLLKENAQFLKELAQTNTHKRYIISGRFGFLEDITKSLLKRHRFEQLFHATEFNFANKQPHIFKHEMIQKHNIHHFIDDDLPLLQFLAAKNSKTIFYWLNKKRKEKLAKNLFAISRLSDILK